MGKERTRPSWWKLWLLLPVLGILGFLETRVPLSTTGHRIVEVGIVLVVFGLVIAWLRANEGAMLRDTTESARQASHRLPEMLLVLPPDLTIDANSNGSRHRQSAWYRPEQAAFLLEPEEQAQDE